MKQVSRKSIALEAKKATLKSKGKTVHAVAFHTFKKATHIDCCA